MATIANAKVKCPQIQNCTSPTTGKEVPNQFIIYDISIVYKNKKYTGTLFQSYDSIIAFISSDDTLVLLDERFWDYSRTTGKYRNEFLRSNKTDTLKKIKSGEIKLANLN